MYLLKSLAIAMAMYSRIPMPKVDWNEKNMKCAMCFFPAVGLVVGTLEFLVGNLLWQSDFSPLFSVVSLTILPVLVTGGIHMDGFMDTMDALASCGDRERKLEILKDSHAGAFAILGMCVYFLWNVAVWGEVSLEMLPVICCGYVLSRTLSGLSVVTFRPARNSGLARTFQDGAHKRTVKITMILLGFLTAAVMIFLDRTYGIAALAAGLLVFAYYRHLCTKQFGGITGDLAGYFLQLCELFMLTAVVLAGGASWK